MTRKLNKLGFAGASIISSDLDLSEISKTARPASPEERRLYDLEDNGLVIFSRADGVLVAIDWLADRKLGITETFYDAQAPRDFISHCYHEEGANNPWESNERKLAKFRLYSDLLTQRERGKQNDR